MSAGGSVTDFQFGVLSNIFRTALLKESNFHAVGTSNETDGLLKDLIRSAGSLVIHKICKFKTLYFLMRC